MHTKKYLQNTEFSKKSSENIIAKSDYIMGSFNVRRYLNTESFL